MFKWIHSKAKSKDLPEIKTDTGKMIIDLHDRPKARSWILLAVQHVIAMFGATVLIPTIINNGVGAHFFGANSGMAVNVIGTDVALFSSGVGTLIYIAVTRARVPMYLGSSAAYVGSMLSLFPIYGTSAFFGFLGVGLIYMIVAFFIYLFGTGWLKKLLPPVVVGPMIMVIGLGLAKFAVGWLGIDNIDKINWWGLSLGIITTAIAVGMSLLFTGRLKLMPILGAMMIGLILSLIVSTWEGGIIKYQKDWSDISTYIGAPDFKHTIIAGGTADIPVEVKVPAPHTGTHNVGWKIFPFFAMMPVAFATIAEHIGDHTVLGKITGRDYINGKPGLHRTLIGDGLATAFAGLVGGPANTSYGENTTTTGLSRVGSVWVTGLAAVFAVGMSFLQIVPSILGLIPTYVLGGVSLVLFGFIASNGFKVLMDQKVDLSDTRNVFIISIMLIIGIGGAVIGWKFDNTTISFGGTSLSMMAGMLANAIIPKDRGIDESKMPQISNKDKIKKHKQ